MNSKIFLEPLLISFQCLPHAQINISADFIVYFAWPCDYINRITTPFTKIPFNILFRDEIHADKFHIIDRTESCAFQRNARAEPENLGRGFLIWSLKDTSKCISPD